MSADFDIEDVVLNERLLIIVAAVLGFCVVASFMNAQAIDSLNARLDIRDLIDESRMRQLNAADAARGGGGPCAPAVTTTPAPAPPPPPAAPEPPPATA